MVYYITLLILIIAQYFILIKKKNTQKFFLPMCIVEMIIFTSLRGHDIGSDIVGYLEYYSNIKSYLSIEPSIYNISYILNNVHLRYELGYSFLNILCALFSMSETGYLTVLSMFTYISLYYFIKKYSVMPLISLLAYIALELFSFSLGIFRQSIAVTIIMIGVIMIDRIKVRHWLFICLIAFMFHKTSLVAIPIYWFRNLDIRSTYRYLFASGFLLFFIGRYIVDSIVSNMTYYNGFIGSVYDTQGGYFLLLIYSLVTFVAYLLIPNHVIHRNDKTFLISLPVVCNLLVLSSQFGILIRLTQYYTILVIIAIPKVLSYLKNKNHITLLGVMCIFLLFLLSIYVLNKHPYVSDFHFE